MGSKYVRKKAIGQWDIATEERSEFCYQARRRIHEGWPASVVAAISHLPGENQDATKAEV